MASPRQVVVDDTDSRIIYSGGSWFQDNGGKDDVGNQGPTYKQTSHATKGDATLSFTFKGTSVVLHGTYQPTGDDSPPRWECFIDEISIGASKPPELPENHVNLCGKDGLQDGEHKFRLQVTTTKATFWVDSFLITPSPRTSFGDTVLLVQDSDPGVSLGSDWEKLEDIASITHVKGSTAKFEFVGKRLTWFGVIFFSDGMATGSASGSFSIDGGPSTGFELSSANKDPNVNHYNQAFFTTPELKQGSHTLSVTYNGADGPATPLTLDYLYITTNTVRDSPPPENGTPSPSPSPTTTPSSPAGSSQGGGSQSGGGSQGGGTTSAATSSGASSGSNTPLAVSINTNAPAVSFISGASTTFGASSITSLSTASDPSQTGTGSTHQLQSSSPPIGAIVGGSLGGVAVIGLIVLLLFLLRRRRKRPEITQQPCKVIPFTFAAPSTSQNQFSAPAFDEMPQSKEAYRYELPPYPAMHAVRRQDTGSYPQYL